MPLGDNSGHHDTDDALSRSPSPVPISQALREIKNQFPICDITSLELSFEQVRATTIWDAVGLDAEQLENRVGMPVDMIPAFQDLLSNILNRPRRSKGLSGVQE